MKTLTQSGHPFIRRPEASLRSDNCPVSPERCPTWIGIGVRFRRNPQLGRNQTIALGLIAPEQTRPKLDEMVRNYESEIARYNREERQLQNQAKAFEKQYDLLNYKDDQFDLSDAALSISLGMLAVASLTYKRWVLGLSWFFGGFGVVMGMAGLSGLHFHPDWLTKLLS